VNIENVINDKNISDLVVTTPTTWLLSIGVAFIAGACYSAKKVDIRVGEDSLLARLEKVESIS
jgi:hypothetical protein